MRYLRGPLVALFAFLLGVVVSPIHFQVESRGQGRITDGNGRFFVTSFRSSYFVELTFAHYSYDSPEKANAVFAEHVAQSIEVTEITPKLDAQGKIVVRRAVTTALNHDRTKHLACVFWTDGSMLHAVTSASLLHVLDFEKQHAYD